MNTSIDDDSPSVDNLEGIVDIYFIQLIPFRIQFPSRPFPTSRELVFACHH